MARPSASPALLPSRKTPGAFVPPLIVTNQACTSGSGESGMIAGQPDSGTSSANSMPHGLVSHCASRSSIAWRSVPAPESAVLVTRNQREKRRVRETVTRGKKKAGSGESAVTERPALRKLVSDGSWYVTVTARLPCAGTTCVEQVIVGCSCEQTHPSASMETRVTALLMSSTFSLAAESRSLALFTT